MEEASLLEQIKALIVEWYPVVTSVIGTMAVIATQTKNKSNNRLVQFFCDMVNLLAMNVGKSKNAPE